MSQFHLLARVCWGMRRSGTGSLLFVSRTRGVRRNAPYSRVAGIRTFREFFSIYLSLQILVILFQQLDCFCLLGCFCRLLMLMRFGLTRVGCYCRILRASYILCLVATEMTQLLENYFSELNTLFIIASCRSQATD